MSEPDFTELGDTLSYITFMVLEHFDEVFPKEVRR